MHGLIFKIKESHRQDQSESFVIYVEKHGHWRTTSMYLFINNKSNEITSLWPVLMIVYIHIDEVYACKMIDTLFHRDETKPTHIIGIITFLFFQQLFYKHSSPNKHHLIRQNKPINKMLSMCYSCISWNIFNRIHIFASCDVLLECRSRFVLSCDT